MWLSNHLKRIRNHGGPIVLAASAAFGTQHLIAALQDANAATVWLELTPSDEDDLVAQGNHLAEAVQRALGNPLFDYALPYSYGLTMLDTHLDLLGPFTFVLSGAEFGPGFARELLPLGRGDNRVVLDFTTLPENLHLPEDALVLGESELRLTCAEALDLSAGRLDRAEVEELLTDSCGAYESFRKALNRRLNLPPPLRPGPTGFRVEDLAIAPNVLVDMLIKRGKWLEALERAVFHLPERVPDIIKEAGHVYHEQGLHKRLWKILNKLPEDYDSEDVIFWKLSAAYWTGQAECIRARVEDYLAKHEAPEVRALYAGVLASDEQAKVEAKRAYECSASPLTVYQYGRTLFGTEEGTKVLRTSVQLAERTGRQNDIVRNANSLVTQLIFIGRYKEAVHWGDWTLARFNESGMGNAQRRLLITNEWAFARILTGETAGVFEQLAKGEDKLSQVLPLIARVFRSTLGDYFLATGQPEKALAYYLDGLESAPRHKPINNLLGATQAFLHLEEVESALEVTTRAKALTRGECGSCIHEADLAYGLALTMSDPSKGKPYLSALQKELKEHELPAHESAQLSLYLAWAHLQLGASQEACQALKAGERGLKELSLTGLRLLSGPEHLFQDVWQLLGEQDFSSTEPSVNRKRTAPKSTAPKSTVSKPTVVTDPGGLSLTFLGCSHAAVNGAVAPLSPRTYDVLALLALHPEGLSAEQLLALLYGDGGNKNTLKGLLSRLRRLVGVGSRPYRLTCPVNADFTEVTTLLAQGRVTEALERYTGPLLPASEAPGILEAREELEEDLRQSVLAGKDADDLYTLAAQLKDDLELWEAAANSLPKEDSRLPLVKSRVKRLEKKWLG